MVAASNEGREPNVIKSWSMRDEVVVQISVVTLSNVCCPANEGILVRTNVLKDGKDPPRKCDGIFSPSRSSPLA